jgi:hypothetical protein
MRYRVAGSSGWSILKPPPDLVRNPWTAALEWVSPDSWSVYTDLHDVTLSAMTGDA